MYLHIYLTFMEYIGLVLSGCNNEEKDQCVSLWSIYLIFECCFVFSKIILNSFGKIVLKISVKIVLKSSVKIYNSEETRGIVVKSETHVLEVVGSKPNCGNYFSLRHSFGSKQGQKYVRSFNLNMCCNPPIGRVNIEKNLAYKTQLRGLE